MIAMSEYLKGIYKDLQDYVDNDVCLCKLIGLNFEAGALPDYEDKNIQQLYLLRYAFAYSFEYSRMYLDVLTEMGDFDNISVTSIGCGSMIDYWSLVYALNKEGVDCSIRYDGIDRINWNYRIPGRQVDEVHYTIENAVNFFGNNSQFTSDIIFFPKSISEFSESELNTMADSFSSKNKHKDKFFVCISLRDDPGSKNRDVIKTKCIIEAVSNNGFKTNFKYDENVSFDNGKGIALEDNYFHYPSDALNFVKNLYNECVNYKVKGKKCKLDCYNYLSRSPILKTNHIRYQVIKFERMN